MSANVSGIFLSQWVNVPALAERAVAIFASSAPDKTTPSKDPIREVQQQARSCLSVMVSGASSFTTLVGRATKDNEDLFRVGLYYRRVVDSGTSEGNADAAHGMRSHKGSWTPEGRDDFAAATMVPVNGARPNMTWYGVFAYLSR